MDTLLHTEALAVGYGHEVLLRDVNIDAGPGGLIAVIGANGTGKSTLLRTLAGLHAPLGGRVMVQGRDVSTMPAGERAKAVSIVLTGRPLAGFMDVETLVSLGRQPWTSGLGRLTDTDRAQVHEAMEQMHVLDLRHRAIASLSDGECQRVMIARALAQHTPLMLLDEPTAFLDVAHRVQVVHLLRTIVANSSRTMLFSSHDLQLVLDLSDHVLLLRRDRSFWQGAPMSAISEGVLAAEFKGAGVRFDPATRAFRAAP